MNDKTNIFIKINLENAKITEYFNIFSYRLKMYISKITKSQCSQ